VTVRKWLIQVTALMLCSCASGASPVRACVARRSTASVRPAPSERPGGPDRPQDV